MIVIGPTGYLHVTHDLLFHYSVVCSQQGIKPLETIFAIAKVTHAHYMKLASSTTHTNKANGCILGKAKNKHRSFLENKVKGCTGLILE